MSQSNNRTVSKVTMDSFSQMLLELRFDITSFGRHIQHDAGEMREFTIGDCELFYILGGKVCLSSGGKSFIAKPGTLCFFKPLTMYTIQNLPGEPVEYYYIHFDINPVYRLAELADLVLGDGEGVFLPGEIPGVDMMMSSLYHMSQEEAPGFYASLSCSIISLMLRMSRVSSERSQEAAGDDHKEISEKEVEAVNISIHYIQEHLQNPIKVSDISAYVGVSENYLYKSFVSVMRMPPSKYILRYKVKRAEKLLKTGEYSVEEISRMLGFSSLFHFSKTFKDYFGVSPKRYIKTIAIK